MRRVIIAIVLIVRCTIIQCRRVTIRPVYNFSGDDFPTGAARLKRAAPALYVVFCGGTKYSGGKHSVITGNNRSRRMPRHSAHSARWTLRLAFSPSSGAAPPNALETCRECLAWLQTNDHNKLCFYRNQPSYLSIAFDADRIGSFC